MNIKKIIILILSSLISYYCINMFIKMFYFQLIYIPFIVLLIIIAYKTPLVFLIILTMFYEMFFQMYPFWIPPWQFRDFTILILCTGIIVQLIKNGFRLKLGTNNYYYKYILLIFAIIFLTIFFGSYLILDQNINSLIFRGRPYFLYLVFLYLCLSEFNIDQINKYILFIVFSAVIVSLLLIIDAKLLGGFKIFIYASINGVSGLRGGNIRIAVFVFMTLFSYFYLLSTIKITKNPKMRLLSILSLAIITYQIVFILMTRQILVYLFMTTILFLVNIKSLFFKTFIYCTLSLTLLGVILFYLNNPILAEETFFFKILERTKVEAAKKDEGNIGIRIKGIKFYYTYFKKTYFIGMGMTAVTDENSPEYIGSKKGLLFTDLGFFAVLYRFGIFSIILSAVIFTRVFKDLSFIQKNGNARHKTIANSLTYFLISTIIFLPVLKGFFNEGHALYYGIIFYIIYKLKSEITLQNTRNATVLNCPKELV